MNTQIAAQIVKRFAADYNAQPNPIKNEIALGRLEIINMLGEHNKAVYVGEYGQEHWEEAEQAIKYILGNKETILKK